MAEGRVKRWFVVAAAATLAAVIVYTVSFSIAFDRGDAGQDPGPAGAVVWPAALISLVGSIVSVTLMTVWLSRRGSRAARA